MFFYICWAGLGFCLDSMFNSSHKMVLVAKLWGLTQCQLCGIVLCVYVCLYYLIFCEYLIFHCVLSVFVYLCTFMCFFSSLAKKTKSVIQTLKKDGVLTDELEQELRNCRSADELDHVVRTVFYTKV